MKFPPPNAVLQGGIAFGLAQWAAKLFHYAPGLSISRDISHYAQVFRLADQANLLLNLDLAVMRMRQLPMLHGAG